MSLSNFVSLLDVFVIPDFNVNLLCVHKIHRDNKCKFVLNENNCVIQDSLSKETVETANESCGLYYLKDNFVGRISFLSKSSLCCISKLPGIIGWVILLIIL